MLKFLGWLKSLFKCYFLTREILDEREQRSNLCSSALCEEGISVAYIRDALMNNFKMNSVISLITL